MVNDMILFYANCNLVLTLALKPSSLHWEYLLFSYSNLEVFFSSKTLFTAFLIPLCILRSVMGVVLFYPINRAMNIIIHFTLEA